MNIISLDNISWRRENDFILREVFFSVNAGEHWCIVGANGSGKSTMLNIIAGYIWPSIGTVHVLGQRYGTCSLPEMRKRIGWVTSALASNFTESRPFETAKEVVESGRFASVGIYEDVSDEDSHEAERLLAQFGCHGLMDAPFRNLSQGEKQRVLLARAFMAHPEILILDEPCTGLDILARELLLTNLEVMVKENQAPTILYVTHHVEEILPFFTHALLLQKGQVLAAGPKKSVLTATHLTNALGVPVEVAWSGDRPWATVVRE